ncbi:hypothetical protein EG68_05357 [Paragonimus skrjabini miyazakii]|uniref:Uncharacterized protein n=1 Tax=Paragonimus skrjabini miyazakii TaxID=59628 RepID=A0A8S9YRY3_9TREM|nr:hypothetical protein EG68_05357 [Paragonimus skrjabini miyazakii]
MQLFVNVENADDLNGDPAQMCAIRGHMTDRDNRFYKELQMTIPKHVLRGYDDTDLAVREYFTTASNRDDLVVSLTTSRPSFVVLVETRIKTGLPSADIESSEPSQLEYCAYLQNALELTTRTMSCSGFEKRASLTGPLVVVALKIRKTTVYYIQSPKRWYIPSKIAEKLNSNGRPNIYNVRWDKRFKYPDASH